MATCDPFDATFTGDAATLFNKMKAYVESQGGVVNGDQNSGAISASVPILGNFQGTYSISGQTVTITVTERPFLLPCSTIQNQVNTFINS